MALKIKGVEPQIIKVDDNGAITELTNLRIYKNGELKCSWIKPYKLTISKGEHSTVTVGVKISQYASISESVSDGSTIRHGSYLEIVVAGRQGYEVSWKLNGVTQSASTATIEVTGNVVISVTETAVVQSLGRPSISGSFSFDSYGGFYYLTCQITNSNPRAVAANITVFSNGDRLDGTDTLNIPANSTQSYPYGAMFSIGAKVQVTFSCAGYGDSSASATFGNYNGTDDETTSTTS